jgi:hypothetical protein
VHLLDQHVPRRELVAGFDRRVAPAVVKEADRRSILRHVLPLSLSRLIAVV